MTLDLNELPLREAARIGFELFRAPHTRETAAKEMRILESATRVEVAHQQILDWPPTMRPEITLTAYVWENAGSSVLLTHGWEFQAGRMGAFVKPLLQAGFRVVAFDAPAHGQSQGEFSTLLDYEEAILNMLRILGVSWHAIIGHSFGGMSAAWALARHPELAIQKLVLIAAGTDVEFLLQSSPRFQQASAELKQGLREEFRRRVGRWPAEYNAAEAGATLQAHTLVIHDQRDYMVPFTHAEAYVAYIPNAQLLATNGLGHRAILRDAQVVAETVRFLSASVSEKYTSLR